MIIVIVVIIVVGGGGGGGVIIVIIIYRKSKNTGMYIWLIKKLTALECSLILSKM